LPWLIAPLIRTISLIRGMISGALNHGQGDIGQWPDRTERDRPGRPRQQRLDDEVDRMLRLQRHAGLGQVGAVQAGFAMHVLGGDQGPQDRPGAAGIDRHVRAAGQGADLAGVALCQRQRHVAGDRGDADELQLFAGGKRQQDRQGVVLAGIAVEDDGTSHAAMVPPG